MEGLTTIWTMTCSATATTGVVTTVTMITMTMVTVMVGEVEDMVDITMVLPSAITEVKEEKEEGTEDMRVIEEGTIMGEEEEEGITEVTEPLLVMSSTITDSPELEAGHRPFYVLHVLHQSNSLKMCHVPFLNMQPRISFFKV